MNANVQAWIAQGKFFRLGNLDIYYQTLGHGPAIFLLHGYPYCSYDFRLIAPGEVLKAYEDFIAR